jgi:UDP-N-acetylglucosamine--N-acetylmuramyl-(pentapeptide) pyrophosphoryl-undecaprenol N-acetylglucosamine transferase
MKEKRFMNLHGHKRIIISGGGTGGHVFPAISVANALRRIDADTGILFAGAEGRIEMEAVPAAGYRIKGLPVSGFYRKLTLRNLKMPFNLIRSLRIAKKIIREFNPDAVAGFGGYASGPVLWQAGRMGIPTLIQEQNSYAGITNRILSKKAKVICVAYEGMDKYFHAGKIVMTGNPVRQNFEDLNQIRDEALSFFGLNRDIPVILVLGGSLGAKSINMNLSDNIGKLAESGCQWLWQTGKLYFKNVSALLQASVGRNISLHDFINRMDYAYAAADVIISRAGAGTISELCLAGKPVILVPSPNVAEDHQTRNAMALSGKGAAIVIPDDKASEALVDEAIRLVSDNERKEMLSGNIKRMAERNADIRIAEEIMRLAGK